MATESKISVVLPTYNDRDYLESALESLRSQTLTPHEIIVVDGGSTDGTLEFLYSIDGGNLRVFSDGNLVDSLNRGCREAVGTYIARVDADTVSHPDRLERQRNFLDEHPEVGMVGTNVKRINVRSGDVRIDCRETDHNKIARGLVQRNQLVHPTLMMRKSALADVGYYRDYTWEDYELATRMMRDYQVANIDDVLMDVYERPDSISMAASRWKKMKANSICGVLALRRGNFSKADLAYLSLVRIRHSLRLLATSAINT